jgi:nitrite reductase/ring-hydroxylating ferredoxin subunit
MERRDFLKSSCGLCMMLGSGLLGGMLESCASSGVYEAERIGESLVVPLSRFDINELQIVRCEGEQYNIAVHRRHDNTYLALLMACTHAVNELVRTGDEFVCRLHGSRYNEDGEVMQGPAERPMRVLATKTENDRLLIFPG